MASVARILEEEVYEPLTVLELPVRQDYVGNRRSLPRVSGRFEVHCTDGSTYTGADLSFGGLLCFGDDPLWPGNHLRFALELPGEQKPLHVTGRVVELVSFRGRVGMRVRFFDLDAQSRKRIAQWMARENGV